MIEKHPAIAVGFGVAQPCELRLDQPKIPQPNDLVLGLRLRRSRIFFDDDALPRRAFEPPAPQRASQDFVKI